MTLFKGNNRLGARDLFITRAVYDGFALTNLRKVNEPTVETLQIKDLRKDEKMLYGRINASNHPIYPRSRYLKPFPSNGKQRALDFVVDAFEDMKRKFDKHVSQGYLQMDDPILSSLQIQNGYISPKVEYDLHISRVEADFEIFLNNKSRINKVVDFDSFIPVFMEYVELTNPGNPLTRSMYSLTNQTAPLASGLMFEIFKADAGTDEPKIDKFYKNRNFEYFKNLAFQYGFILDKHIPWRVIADINSPAMSKYIQKAMATDAASGYSMLQIYFRETYSQDIPSLMNLVLSLYNSVAVKRPFERKFEPAATVSSFSGKTKTKGCKEVKNVRRKRMSFAQLVNQYPPSFWLDLYTKIRNFETGLLYGQGTVEFIANNAIDLENKLDIRTAMRYIISKFDNVEHHGGSFFHDTVRLEMAEDPTATDSDVSEKVQRSVQASNFVVY